MTERIESIRLPGYLEHLINFKVLLLNGPKDPDSGVSKASWTGKMKAQVGRAIKKGAGPYEIAQTLVDVFDTKEGRIVIMELLERNDFLDMSDQQKRVFQMVYFQRLGYEAEV